MNRILYFLYSGSFEKTCYRSSGVKPKKCEQGCPTSDSTSDGRCTDFIADDCQRSANLDQGTQESIRFYLALLFSVRVQSSIRPADTPSLNQSTIYHKRWHYLYNRKDWTISQLNETVKNLTNSNSQGIECALPTSIGGIMPQACQSHVTI
ncbi:hypothetical protein OUZ56_017600 [Daphnia magna]|uniref:Uncharacterized protein n=1 Tax=Daphnia magna TaxID=35525 RepID=A0ABR0AT73_9CRUS|nr:hypothetical protein OUZ56_017600 [Daphnia magna]